MELLSRIKSGIKLFERYLNKGNDIASLSGNSLDIHALESSIARAERVFSGDHAPPNVM